MTWCGRQPSDTVPLLVELFLQEQGLSVAAVCLLKYAGICPAVILFNVKAQRNPFQYQADSMQLRLCILGWFSLNFNKRNNSVIEK